jgi:hypothetical protein
MYHPNFHTAPDISVSSATSTGSYSHQNISNTMHMLHPFYGQTNAATSSTNNNYLNYNDLSQHFSAQSDALSDRQHAHQSFPSGRGRNLLQRYNSNNTTHNLKPLNLQSMSAHSIENRSSKEAPQTDDQPKLDFQVYSHSNGGFADIEEQLVEASPSSVLMMKEQELNLKYLLEDLDEEKSPRI